MKQLPPVSLQVHLSNHFDLLSSFFSALHGMPARTSDEKGVRLYVCQTRLL